MFVARHMGKKYERGNGKTIKGLAKEFGVSEGYIGLAHRVLLEASPEAIAAIDNGEASVHHIYRRLPSVSDGIPLPLLDNEAAFQDRVVKLARDNGWLVYDTPYKVGAPQGYPDLTMAHPERGVIFAELKHIGGVIRKPQCKWIAQLTAAGADMRVWFPTDAPEICDALGVDGNEYAAWVERG